MATVRRRPISPLAAVTDAETGVIFPSELGGQSLMATGVRRKLGTVKVYAVGLYLERRSKLWGSSPSIEQFLAGATREATLRMVITSSLVTQDRLIGALRESIRPRLAAIKGAPVDEVMDEFAGVLLDGPPLKRGTVILFTFKKSGVQVQMGTAYKAEVKSVALARALLSAYTGKNAVVPMFREAIFEALREGL
eukprot:CAMPEP_0171106972 /NCGR_PEP_ID=MMETSP0766_2-20121228/65890_1 /TAXON_ID=439317 /ORGANISM="Gambierdiscus australes, Strain CAWD 149" /LENGTH=193 /DNA_ID=CAMNT_0011568191 /DNA_START=104 /DNA_END=685 /DNA_ORIENTATION=+